MTTITRYHDICMGHRVHGHENKCAHLHGHNYRFYFTLIAPFGLDEVGRVLDFSIIKEKLCEWLENEWDHKTILFEDDPVIERLFYSFQDDIVRVPFNPTAENIAEHMVKIVGPMLLKGTRCILYSCKVDETRKCSATYTIDQHSDEFYQIMETCDAAQLPIVSIPQPPAPLTDNDYQDLPF